MSVLRDPTHRLAAGGAVLAVLCACIAALSASAPLRAIAIGGAILALTAMACRLRRRDLDAMRTAQAIAARLAGGDGGPDLPVSMTDRLASFAAALDRVETSIAGRRTQFALLAQAAGDTFWDWDIRTDLVACTDGGLVVPGAAADSFIEPFAWWQDRVHPDDRATVSAHAAEIRARSCERWSVEYRFLDRSGNWRWVWDRGVVVGDEAGAPVRVVGCMTDISARKDAEEMLQHVERRQRALITAVSSIIWRDDLYAETQPRNPNWEEFTGQTQAEEFGHGWLNAVHPDDREGMLAAWSGAMSRGEIYQADVRLRRRDGTYRWMSARGAPVHDKTGKIVEYIGLYEDVEDYYAAREELRHKTQALARRVKEMRCLHAISVVSNLDRLKVSEILDGVVLVLPSALKHPEAAICRIEWDGRTYGAPCVSDPSRTAEVPIGAEADTKGRILLGYVGRLGGVAIEAEEEQLLKTAGNLVSQMLARRKDWDQLENQSQELWRRQAMFEQTERLARVGGWEYVVATESFVCSEEVRRIAAMDEGVDAAGGGGVPAFLSETLREAERTRQPFDRELAWVVADGSRRWLHAVGQVQIVEARPVRVFGIVKDITEEKEARSRVLHLANHDALTGLPNRRFFASTLEEMLARAGEVHALALIDLDHFKEVNDTLGHDVGDELLRVVSARLKAAAGPDATVARLGGDEFAVMARVADRAAARALAERLLANLRGPVSLAGQPGLIACSIGLAVSPKDGSTAAELLKNADIALYSGKAGGRSAFVTYAPHLRRSVESRIAICAEVRESLERDEFVPFYQPKINLRTGAIAGFEALLRWRQADGVRGPATMMPAFEDYALAQAIHARMLDCILTDILAWRRDGLPFDHVALNTAPAQYAGFDLAEDVLRRLSQAGLEPSCLGIEVTETVLLGRDADSVGPTLRRLHDAGVSIALDDFGTGYASLTHLQQYPVDIIKIDRSFIRALGVDSGSQAITAALLGLGRNLEMTVVAEGVELAEQAEILRTAGCDQAQGYLFARPMPAAAVPAFIASAQAGEGRPHRPAQSAA